MPSNEFLIPCPATTASSVDGGSESFFCVILLSGIYPTSTPFHYFAAVLDEAWQLEEAQRRRRSGAGSTRRMSRTGELRKMICSNNKEEDDWK